MRDLNATEINEVSGGQSPGGILGFLVGLTEGDPIGLLSDTLIGSASSSLGGLAAGGAGLLLRPGSLADGTLSGPAAGNLPLGLPDGITTIPDFNEPLPGLGGAPLSGL